MGNRTNGAGQVGLQILKVYGQPLGYFKNGLNMGGEQIPIISPPDPVDKVLIEMGLPIGNL